MEQPNGHGLHPDLRAAVALLLNRPPEVEIAQARLAAGCLQAAGVLDATGLSVAEAERMLLGNRLSRPEWTRPTTSGVVPPLLLEPPTPRPARSCTGMYGHAP